MDSILNQPAVIVALACAGLFFMTALITGSWKFYSMMHSEEFKAPYYVDVAHRASLLYSFAAILIAVFAFFSPFVVWVSVTATIAPLLFFAIAIFHYIKLGIENTTDNQLRDSDDPKADKIIMLSLMTAEIGGFLVLLIGFFIRVF